MRKHRPAVLRALSHIFGLTLAISAGSVAAAPDCTVALWGDSILYGGFGGSLANRIKEPPAAALKRIRPAWTIADFSVPGDSAYKRMPTFVMQPMPSRVVALQYGINDAGNGYEYEPALRAMLDHVKAAGKTPIVTGLSQVKPGGTPRRDEYHAIARRAAEDAGAVFADWGSVPFNAADMADDVHPAQAYSARLVQRLAITLDRIAPECARATRPPAKGR